MLFFKWTQLNLHPCIKSLRITPLQFEFTNCTKEILCNFQELLEEEFRRVSDGISELENLNEEIDIAENKNHHKQQLQMYKERKNQELEQAKGSKI